MYVNKKVNKQLFVYFTFALIFASILKISCVLWHWISPKFHHFQLFVYILNQIFVYKPSQLFVYFGFLLIFLFSFYLDFQFISDTQAKET